VLTYFTRISHILQEENKIEKKYEKKGARRRKRIALFTTFKGITIVPLFRKTSPLKNDL
jgi:hypothetical protein